MPPLQYTAGTQSLNGYFGSRQVPHENFFLLWSLLVLIHPKLSLLLSDCFHNGHKLLFETWDRLLWPLLGGLAFRTFLSSMVLQTDSLIYRVVGET